MSATLVRKIYDSGAVAFGSAIDSGPLEVGFTNLIAISVLNTTDATRTVTFQGLLSKSTSDTCTGALTVSSAATATNRLAVVGIKATSTAGINLDGYAIPPPPYMRVQCAAGGTSGAVRIIIWGK